MMRILLVAVLTVIAAPVFASDLNLSISMGEPGFYGRIDIGDAPKPAVIYVKPVIVHRESTPRYVEPIYLHVPPGYEKHWSKHCREYDACGRPVYFVKDTWYEETYVPSHGHGHEHHGNGHGNHHHH